MEKEIRFVDVFGHTAFTIPDGGSITLTYADGEQSTLACKYRNEHHTEIGSTMYHIDEFASRMAQIGAVYTPEGIEPDVYEIHQIDNSAVDYMFRSYDEAQPHFKGADYTRKYTGVLSPKTTLDGIYRFHNIDSRPFGRSMRSVSVSDVIVLRRGGESSAHYVDTIGFTEVPRFFEQETPYKLMPFEPGEEKLFFRLDGEAAERHGAVGYMRADFGRGGDGFYTTWFDNQRHLKVPAFKSEFDEVINTLRDGIFNDRRSLEAYCLQHAGQRIGDRGVGFKVQTDAYTYCFRCNPTPHDYDIYCFVFDNRYLLPERAGHHSLPNYCFCVLPSTGEMIRVVRGETSYYPCNSAGMASETIRFKVDDENQLRDVTRAQEEAMLAGSMLGWDTPAAKPWNYNQDGTPRRLPPKKEEPERT